MRIFCSICKDIFIPYSEINATTCGHLYHGSCISRWYKHNKTCPQCRAQLQSSPIRIYFDVDKEGGQDASVLEHQLETLAGELKQKDSLNKTLREENEKYERILNGMEECATALKRKNDLLKSSIQALKDQVITLSKQSETTNKLRSDVESLQMKINSYKSLELIINSTADEADKVLKQTPVTEFGIKQLSIYASALKDKTEKDKQKLAQLAKEKRELEKVLIAEQMKKSNISDEEYNKLKASHNALEMELENAKKLLKKYSKKVENSSDEGSTLNELKLQAPMKRPLFRINMDVDDDNNKESKNMKSPESDVAKRIKHWKDMVAAGPSRQIGLSNKLKLSLNSSSSFSSHKLEMSKSNYAFDGMGGSKKIGLGHPTPKDEFEKISKSDKKNLLKSKDISFYMAI